ncbi:Lrp/AsnC family transcriptional regulator [Roseateles koreensis]|uniref:siroheme decarboxylase n=1 Tax=Roseateles koreensis TaxID=2987526 RepID=A0ABT5KU22_9BURK|nr:Lrp/AsnC family transcriptional regulator [Roseateles koreensis]MDC8786429.1 Lrp/AsnC family transcriptional regulator [Roseateles koreensis]
MSEHLPATLDALDAAVINRLQGTLPLVPRPFAAVAEELGCSEDLLLLRLRRLLADGTLSRFGPLFQIERAGGRFVLAAMQVPEDRFAAVSAQLNALPEVAHNYRREHALNMWFVLATEKPEDIAPCCARIEAMTGLNVLAFPKEREYFVGLHLQAHAHVLAHPPERTDPEEASHV